MPIVEIRTKGGGLVVVEGASVWRWFDKSGAVTDPAGAFKLQVFSAQDRDKVLVSFFADEIDDVSSNGGASVVSLLS